MSSSSLRRCRLGRSTAQANLAKILTIIVTVPPTPTHSPIETTTNPNESLNLDLTLGPSTDMPRESEIHATPAMEEEEIPTAHSGIINCPKFYDSFTVNKVSKKIRPADSSSEGECSPESAPIILESVREISEITNTSCKPEEQINGETESREGYFDLLLEAAKQVSGEVKEDDDKNASTAFATRKRTERSPETGRSKRRAVAPAIFNAYEETEPIVRSRRGRKQTLPSRYRDSILEPWRKTSTVLRR